jgi:hypothetical protein
MPNHLIERLQSQGVNDPVLLARALGVSADAMKIKLGIGREPIAQAEPEVREMEEPRFKS